MNVKELLDVLAPETYVQICNSGVYCCSELPYRKIRSFLDCEVFGIDICNGVLRIKIGEVNNVSTTASVNRGTSKNADAYAYGVKDGTISIQNINDAIDSDLSVRG